MAGAAGGIFAADISPAGGLACGLSAVIEREGENGAHLGAALGGDGGARSAERDAAGAAAATRGERYTLDCLFTLMMAARLAGCRGVTAFVQYVALLSQEQLATVSDFWSPKKAHYTASTFHYILAQMPPKFLDEAVRAWVRTTGLPPLTAR